MTDWPDSGAKDQLCSCATLHLTWRWQTRLLGQFVSYQVCNWLFRDAEFLLMIKTHSISRSRHVYLEFSIYCSAIMPFFIKKIKISTDRMYVPMICIDFGSLIHKHIKTYQRQWHTCRRSTYSIITCKCKYHDTHLLFGSNSIFISSVNSSPSILVHQTPVWGPPEPKNGGAGPTESCLPTHRVTAVLG